MRSVLRKIRVVSDWLDQQRANREVRNPREEYSPKVEDAEKKQDWDERGQASSWMELPSG